MADQFENNTSDVLDDGFSVDDLIADIKQQIDTNPDETELPYEEDPQTAEATELPAVEPMQEDDFTPDFGDAFKGYGEYEEPLPEEPLAPEDYDEDEYDDAEGDTEDAPPPEKPKQKRRKRIVPLFVKVILYVVIVGLIAVGLGYGAWECAQDVLAFGRSDETLTVTVDSGDSLDDISHMLKEQGVIKYPWLFKLYCKFTDSETTIDPGTYVISYNYDYHALVNNMIANSPNRTTVRVMIPEGMTCAQIFELMEKNNVCSAEELKRVAAEAEFDYWFLEGIPYGADNRLEGFLFPDTYDFYEKDDPERVLDKLLTNFDRKFSDEAMEQLDVLNGKIAERLRNAGYDDDFVASHLLSVHDLINVASMIEKESAGVDESSNIASVIYNRLCSPAEYPYLNIDATLIYAIGENRPLTEADKQIDSPYNTYTHTGLPAGPISNPGLSSITAALYPNDTSYYYYALDRATGFHHFSKTYEEHNQFLGAQNNG
ncbi:MAG: endolytic transglycosylase MltG [Clostridia bacterium]|nr:endolytic transglycosylase MltG [Oscillospiraceae bacterium]MBQ3763326.1 endolytic transglycosylase MltG [Clostridia bacterium]